MEPVTKEFQALLELITLLTGATAIGVITLIVKELLHYFMNRKKKDKDHDGLFDKTDLVKQVHERIADTMGVLADNQTKALEIGAQTNVILAEVKSQLAKSEEGLSRINESMAVGMERQVQMLELVGGRRRKRA